MEVVISNARYSNEAQTLYDVTVTRGEETFDYTVSATDQAPLAVAIRAIMADDPLPIAAYEPPPPPPLGPLNPKQLRLGLLAMGISEAAVEAQLNALPEPDRTAALIEWRYAPAYVRTNPLLVQIAAALELDDEDIDEFWRQAEAL